MVEFWFVHEPQNVEIDLREVGDFQDDCATVWSLGNWFAPRRVWKKLVNRSSDKQSERDLIFGLISPVIRLVLQNPRKKERKQQQQPRGFNDSPNIGLQSQNLIQQKDGDL